MPADEIEEIFFYGAGCSTPTKKAQVESVLKTLFPKAIVEVEHDLLAAARATCLHSPGMVAILGTGANSCRFDGSQIVENIPSLGYLLGDEGSGAYIGRQLLIHFLHQELPADLQEEFASTYPQSLEQTLDALYKGTMPSRMLASYMPFMQKNMAHPFIQQLIKEAFSLFFVRYICKYHTYSSLPLHVVGSVGYYFHTLLNEVAETHGVKLGTMLRQPIAGLVLFHNPQAK